MMERIRYHSLLCLGGGHSICATSERLMENCQCHCHITKSGWFNYRGIHSTLGYEFWDVSDAVPHITDQQIADTYRAAISHYTDGPATLTQGEVDAFVATVRATAVTGLHWDVQEFRALLLENTEKYSQEV